MHEVQESEEVEECVIYFLESEVSHVNIILEDIIAADVMVEFIPFKKGEDIILMGT